MDIRIRNEQESEYFYVETMIRDTFWNLYGPGCSEHYLVHKLRKSKDFIAELDFVAEYEGNIVGSAMCSQVKIINDESEKIDNKSIILIGPVCVSSKWQNKGIGSKLINRIKNDARKLGYKGIVLYGNPAYYHRFNFVNAVEFSIADSNGNNYEEFMIFELCKGSLKGIQGRCYESDAFKLNQEEVLLYERNFIGKTQCNNMNDSNLDYSKIKEEFDNANKQFPLKYEECIGLSQDERLIINPCGTYCGDCEDYGVVCDGCRNRNGKPIWYNLYSKNEPCSYYSCSLEKNYHDCSQCNEVPCSKFFEYPDPNMSDDFKQYWFKLRMENFNQINCTRNIEIKNTYKENEDSFKNKK